jgi:hypothetical protein
VASGQRKLCKPAHERAADAQDVDMHRSLNEVEVGPGEALPAKEARDCNARDTAGLAARLLPCHACPP